MIIFTILMVLGISIWVGGLPAARITIEQDAYNDAVLREAKQALIGFAARVTLTTSGTLSGSPRPGDLPCPDTDNDGISNTPCSGSALGRLPWKTLGLPDLRDSAGERLWYAVSVNFKNSPRNPVALNSDTPGSITVRDNTGAIVMDGSGATGATTGAIAVVIAPGSPLLRQDGSVQVRDAAGANLALNFLDDAAGEDNGNFTDNGANGFIQGPVRTADGRIVLNDRILAISSTDLMPVLEKRVIGEVRVCLTEYAAANGNRYPWAAMLNPAAAPDYADSLNNRFGRIPDTTFDQTTGTSSAMSGNWTGACLIGSIAGWWPNWKEVVFYGLADAYKPVAAPMPTPACGSTGSCLADATSATPDKGFVIIAAGRRIGSQLRASNADKGLITNYLEAGNATLGDDRYTLMPATGTFNDNVAFR